MFDNILKKMASKISNSEIDPVKLRSEIDERAREVIDAELDLIAAAHTSHHADHHSSSGGPGEVTNPQT